MASRWRKNGGPRLRRERYPSGAYCEPKMTSVGSQDTTGPMTRDELKDTACTGFSSDFGDAVLLSHCRVSEAG